MSDRPSGWLLTRQLHGGRVSLEKGLDSQMDVLAKILWLRERKWIGYVVGVISALLGLW